MQKIKQLLRDYLNGKLLSEEFVTQYLKLAGKLRDETREALNKKPLIKEELYQNYAGRFEGLISESAYREKWQRLTDQLNETTVKPYSKEEEVLGHLFVEADAYRADPKDRQAGLHIGDSELRAEVKKTLEMLG